MLTTPKNARVNNIRYITLHFIEVDCTFCFCSINDF